MTTALLESAEGNDRRKYFMIEDALKLNNLSFLKQGLFFRRKNLLPLVAKSFILRVRPVFDAIPGRIFQCT